MAIGSVNIGGGGGIKKIYTLYRQENEPLTPKQGDMWVVPIKETSKVTISLDVPAVPIDGELLLQFTNVAYSFDFQEISSKIDGNLNTTQYVYDISSLMKVTLNNNFIGLFQKDVVKEYGVLKRISQFNSTTSLWESPVAYYYNGTEWVNMHYKIFTQATTGVIEKRLPKTNALSETISGVPLSVVRVMPNGNYYVKTKNASGTNLILSKYKADGTFISSATFITHGTTYVYPIDIFAIDDLGFVYILYGTTYIASFPNSYSSTSRHIKKFNANTGEYIYTSDLGNYYPQCILGVGKGKLIYISRHYSSNDARPCVLNLADGTNIRAPFLTIPYSFLFSNAIFEDDGFWFFIDLSDSSNVSYKIVKISYTDLSVMKSAVTENVEVQYGKNGATYVLGMGTNNYDYKTHLFKHPTDADTFVLIYNSPLASSINGLKFDFSIGRAISSKFMVNIPPPTINSNSYTIMAVVDDENIIDIVWYNQHHKYSMDGVALGITTTSLIFPSYANNILSGFHSYYRG